MRSLMNVLTVGGSLGLSLGIGLDLWRSDHEFLAIVAAPVPLMALVQWWSLRRNAITVPLTEPGAEESKPIQVVPIATAESLIWIALVASLFIYALADLLER